MSYIKIGKLYGVTGTAVKNAAKRLGIPLKPRRAINPNETFGLGTAKMAKCMYCGKEFVKYKTHNGKYCSIKCQQEYRYHEYIKLWKTGNAPKMKHDFLISKYIKRFIFEKNNSKCEKCGWGEINKYTNRIPLQIHHIDGNPCNNQEENLQLLCPNCHSLTDNYMGAHKNKTGKTRERTKYYGRDIQRAVKNKNKQLE